MSLESILKPVNWLDKTVQKQYTRLGRKIPEKDLYKVTLFAQIFGKIGTATWGTYIFDNTSLTIPFISGLVIDGPDFSYNVDGLTGKIKKDSNGETKVMNPMQEFNKNYNKKIRLPVFLTGVGFLGKATYDMANYFINGEPISTNTTANITSGLGFLSLATSMYLKDQDPKSLEKKPSKVKAFFKEMYEKAKEIVPAPIPEPVLAYANSNLNDYLSSN